MFVVVESNPSFRSIFEIDKKSKGSLSMIVSGFMHNLAKKIHRIDNVKSCDGEINELAS